VRARWLDQGGHVHEGSHWPDGVKTVWVDAEQPPPASVLSRLFRPHPLVVRQLAGHHPTMGFRVYPDAVVFAVKAPLGDDPRRGVHPLRIVVGERFLLTVHPVPMAVVDEAWRVAGRAEVLASGAGQVLYELLGRHLAMYQRVERELIEAYEDIHRILLKHPYRDLADRILQSRRDFLRLRLALKPEDRVLHLLAEASLPGIRQEQRPYFDDLADQFGDLVDEIDSTREGLSGAVEAYSSLQSNEINKVMKFLTIISVLALPATTIASIYGMNFDIPETHWPWGYWYALGLMAAVTGSLLWYMDRHDWFR
jgi:magnesium transporter